MYKENAKHKWKRKKKGSFQRKKKHTCFTMTHAV